MQQEQSLVLLITDNRRIKDLVVGAIETPAGQSYRIEMSGTLDEALVNLTDHDPTVVLLDINLPDSQGLSTYMMLQSWSAKIPVITLVGNQEEALGDNTVAKGAIEYINWQTATQDLITRSLRYTTERTHTLKQLQASEAKYRELFESVVAGVFQTSPEGRFISANPALVRMLGYDSEDELLALDITRDVYMYPEDRTNWRKAIDEDGKIRNAELVLRKKDGSKIVVLENSRAETDAQGRLIYFEGTLTDITETHEQSAQLSYEASHDPLTGVFNRREFERRLQSLLDNIHVQPGPHAVCYMDLDRFKAINDNCGHVAGDELLRQVAEQLQSRVRHGDTLSRLGGDEFALILHDCGAEDAVRVAEGLRTMVDELRFSWSGQIHTIGASIGVVPISPERRRISEVMGAADAACYRAKDSGRNRVHLYVEDDAPFGGDGLSWATAYDVLEEGIQDFLVPGSTVTEVWVAAGTYVPTWQTDPFDLRSVTIFLRNGLSILGGFAGTETLADQRDPAVNISIISGDIGVPGDPTDNCWHVLRSASPANNTAILDGFTITQGQADGNINRGAALLNDGDAHFLNCVFDSNFSSNRGGAVHNNGSPLFTDCTFSNNISGSAGGGALYGGAPTFIRCTFINNSTDGEGGGINSQQLVISDCIFKTNIAGAGGAG